MEFDIIEYLSGLTNFVFDKAVLKRIAIERGVDRVTSFRQLEQKQKDLLLADLLFTVYVSPNSSASMTQQHGAYSQTVGSQTINDKRGIYKTLVSLYKKWNDEKLEIAENSDGGLQWIE